MIEPLPDLLILPVVRASLAEDLGRAGDITAQACVPADAQLTADFVARRGGVVAGLSCIRLALAELDPGVTFEPLTADGHAVPAGTTLARVSGNARAILTAERTALNLLGRLCGIATLTQDFVDAVAGTHARITDTRKTTPGLRALEKYAVRCGGCVNHRSSLGEHVLIKDNHIAAAGSLTRAVTLARAAAPHLAKIEVEAKTLPEVKEALRAGAEVILLDNMPPEMVRRAVAVIAGAAVVEVSGGVRFETLRDYALPGVDVISIGALTHSATAVDLSLDLVPARGRRR